MNAISPHDWPVRGIRPAFGRVAILACVVLLPVAVHSLWDYVEIRRLVREVEAIRMKGEPVSEAHAAGGRQLLPGEDPGAASYYLAGAMLALHSRPSAAMKPVHEWFAGAASDRAALDDTIARLHELVRASGDALSMADKGAEQPFDGFPAGTEYSYRTAGLSALSELVAARTLSASQAGAVEAAIASVLSGLQIRRALRDARWMTFDGDQVPAMLSLVRPSPSALARLQAALEAEDTPDRELQAFLRERARYVELIWRRYYGSDPNAPQSYSLPTRTLTESVVRPWFTHQAVEVLRSWAELVEIVRAPWPERVRRGAEILEARPPEPAASRTIRFPLLDPAIAVGAFSAAVDATATIVDRASRVALAIERFRYDRNTVPGTLSDLVPRYLGEIPADPFSGRPLLFRQDGRGYTIYSVGANQQDDGGDLASALERGHQQGWGRRSMRGADVGIRVLLSH